MMRALTPICACCLALALPAARADGTDAAENWNAKYQATYVWQHKPAFGARYSGPNSLGAAAQTSYSFTATAAFGYRPWDGGEIYFDPEAAQGVPLSGLTGLGGFTNGEVSRVTGPTLTVYRARLFLRQTWNFGGGEEKVESDMNQLAGSVARDRLVLTLGNLSVLDIFDVNAYSHDPRTQFLNWAFMTYGAFDYAADARGYSWGGAVELYERDWVIRAGRFMQPRKPNQLALDPRIFEHDGDQVELERRFRLGDQSGAVRLLAFRDRAIMGRYDDALRLAEETGARPDIALVRTGEQTKYGFGISAEQGLAPGMGAFARASWADGQTETEAFTEIDGSLSGGVMIAGERWGRPRDSLGIALAQNSLSEAHRRYLAAGGLGFFLGDGGLRYRPERILETYYSWASAPRVWLTLDFQRIAGPGYNADRGPASVGSVRLHAEY